jgi:predicted NBD/HSP70 family sugar kinase/biotin operon repressor
MSTAGTGSLESLREENRARVVAALRRRGVASRADIARQTGLSRSTVSSLVADLQAAGLVTERTEAEGSGRAGRPPVMLGLEARAGVAIGINFDHDRVQVALADLSSTLLGELEREVDVDHRPGDGMDAAAEMASELLDGAGVERTQVIGAGIGLSGPIDQASGRVHRSDILTGWVGVAARELMEERLGVPVRLENDANLGALAEVALGAGRGARDVVYLMLSSGIGAGLVLDGRLFRGTGGMAGEIGHTLVDERGALCRCGNRGCLETLAAGPALVRLVSAARGDAGAGLTIAEVVTMALEGEPGARRAIGDAGRVTGRAVADLVNQLNPELVVVGGQLASAGEVLLEPLRESINRYAIPAAAEAVRIVPSELGARAEVLGALSLVIHQSDPLFAAPLTEAARSA